MPSDTKELRGDAPTHLVCALDALAHSKDITRHAYCLQVLEAHVIQELHKVTVIRRMMRGNPLLPEPTGHAPDAFRPTQPGEL